MFIKRPITNPQVPYNVLVQVSNFAPGYYSVERYQDISNKYKGLEYFEDNTSFLNVYFSHHDPEIKMFKVCIDWHKFATERKIIIENIEQISADIYDYLWWDIKQEGLLKDLHASYTKFLIKVFVVTIIEQHLSDITQLPCYSDYTWLAEDDAAGAEELEVDKIYVVYE